jgi:glyoxylase-like metal-dependent hydrolase (beta-lactamase superfamily II)
MTSSNPAFSSVFSYSEPISGVFHITDIMGVQFTLLTYDNAAVLIDTGYGLFNPRPLLGDILAKHTSLGLRDLRVVLTHAHYDHSLGSRHFDEVYVHPKDFELAYYYTRREFKESVLGQFNAKREAGTLLVNAKHEADALPNGLDFDKTSYYTDTYNFKPLETEAIGGLKLIHTAGHTPGSVVGYDEKRKLLLTGDNWNPTTWLFFSEALPVEVYAQNMKVLLDSSFEHVLASHDSNLISGKRLSAYINGLNEKTFGEAVRTFDTPYPEIETYVCRPEPETSLVFKKANSAQANSGHPRPNPRPAQVSSTHPNPTQSRTAE